MKRKVPASFTIDRWPEGHAHRKADRDRFWKRVKAGMKKKGKA